MADQQQSQALGVFNLIAGSGAAGLPDLPGGGAGRLRDDSAPTTSHKADSHLSGWLRLQVIPAAACS
jgi:hypothetical protein